MGSCITEMCLHEGILGQGLMFSRVQRTVCFWLKVYRGRPFICDHWKLFSLQIWNHSALSYCICLFFILNAVASNRYCRSALQMTSGVHSVGAVNYVISTCWYQFWFYFCNICYLFCSVPMTLVKTFFSCYLSPNRIMFCLHAWFEVTV